MYTAFWLGFLHIATAEAVQSKLWKERDTKHSCTAATKEKARYQDITNRDNTGTKGPLHTLNATRIDPPLVDILQNARLESGR